MADYVTVAEIIDPATGETYDHAYTWETGENYATQGYIVKAIADDGFMTRENAQAMYDRCRAEFIDCYGREIPFEE